MDPVESDSIMADRFIAVIGPLLWIRFMTVDRSITVTRFITVGLQ